MLNEVLPLTRIDAALGFVVEVYAHTAKFVRLKVLAITFVVITSVPLIKVIPDPIE
jgi:hypothetical protein